MPAGPSWTIRWTRAVRRSDLAAAEARCAARSPSQATSARPKITQAKTTTSERTCVSALVVDHDVGDGVGDQPRLGQDQAGRHTTQSDGQQQIAASSPCVVQKTGVDRTRAPRIGPLWPPGAARTLRFSGMSDDSDFFVRR